MGSWADVRRTALALPGAVEDPAGSTTAWRVGRHAFAWERLLRAGERRLLGGAAADGPVLGVRVPDLAARAAWLAEHPDVFFVLPAYETFAVVQLHVEPAPVDVLEEAVTESWLARAPQRLTRPWLAERG